MRYKISEDALAIPDMKVGDLVIRIDNKLNCDSGPPINTCGIVVSTEPTKCILIYWPSDDDGYIMLYYNDEYGLGNLEVINENWR